MGIRNKKRETLRRLDSKTLDAMFLTEVRNGLNCSPFEAEAVLEVVKEVYFPFLEKLRHFAVHTNENLWYKSRPNGKVLDLDQKKHPTMWR